MTVSATATKPIWEEVLRLGDYDSREDLEAEIDMWDSTTAGWYGWCPRNAQLSHLVGVDAISEGMPRIAGRAIHGGTDVLYTSEDEDLAVQAVGDVFGSERDPLPPSHSYSHIHAGFVENIFKNYLSWRAKHDTFKPLVVHYDEIDMTDVVAAVWRVLPDERVILGECKLVMRFDVAGEEFIYAGKPDLPITWGGNILIMDTKVSCSMNLGDWYFKKHVISNQLRGYCRMIERLLQRRVSGALINGVYAGEDALRTRTKKGALSKVTKFLRYGPLLFRPAHLDEAMWNQFAWRKIAFMYQKLAKDYPDMHKAFGYAQNTGISCRGCQYLEVCQATPKARSGVVRRKFVQKRVKFLDL